MLAALQKKKKKRTEDSRKKGKREGNKRCRRTEEDFDKKTIQMSWTGNISYL